MTIRMLIDPPAKPHYRTTHIKGGVAEVYIDTQSKPWVETHTHYFEDLDRFGTGQCIACGVEGWSAWWVADGVFGEGTSAWVDMQAKAWADRIDDDVLARLRAERVTVIAMPIDGSQPARTERLHGRKGSVPTMPLNLTGIPSVHPEYDRNL